MRNSKTFYVCRGVFHTTRVLYGQSGACMTSEVDTDISSTQLCVSWCIRIRQLSDVTDDYASRQTCNRRLRLTTGEYAKKLGVTYSIYRCPIPMKTFYSFNGTEAFPWACPVDLPWSLARQMPLFLEQKDKSDVGQENLEVTSLTSSSSFVVLFNEAVRGVVSPRFRLSSCLRL